MYLLEILTSICISHILVFILLALIRFKKINYYIAMGIGIIAYLLFPLAIKYDFPKFIKLILFIWIVSISFFFWLISIDLSKKYFHPGKKYWAILILKLIISIWSIRPERTFFFLSPTDEIIKNFLRFLPPATFSAVLIILSLYNLYQNLNHDLVDSQKKNPPGDFNYLRFHSCCYFNTKINSS